MSNPYYALALDNGFEPELTGGGCTALTRYYPNGYCVWITDDGGLQYPESDASGWMIGAYDDEGPGFSDPLLFTAGDGLQSYKEALELTLTYAGKQDWFAGTCRNGKPIADCTCC